ncbi:MAG: NUDIX pyrophosphatase [Bacteroidetes bacterium]|nr:NUDIX pyrophosphatase [Bacteroidota bacterium]
MKIISELIEAHIFRKTKNGIEFLLLKRSEEEIYPGLWQMVSGKIHEGEKAFETALRELKEETGLIPKKFWTAPNINSFYYQEGDYISMLPVFAALVDKDSKVVISDEHTEFKWVNPSRAKKMLAWQGQRNSVEIINEYFTKEIRFLNFVEIDIKNCKPIM